MAAQRTAEVRGAELLVPELLPKDVETAKQVSNNDYDVVEATDYYRNRIPMANAPVSSVFSRNAAAVSWNALDGAETLLTNPIMVVIGDKIGAFGSHRFGHDIIRRAAAKEKELVILPFSHYELYDMPEATSQALDKIIPFFGKHI